MSTEIGRLAYRIERLNEELEEACLEADELEAGGRIGGVEVSGSLNEAKEALAPARRALVEDVRPDQERVQHLAHLALQASIVAQRLAPGEMRALQDEVSDLGGWVEEAVRDAFEAMGLRREIPEGFIAGASDDAISRLRMERVGT